MCHLSFLSPFLKHHFAHDKVFGDLLLLCEGDLVLATSLVGEISLSSLAVVNQAVYELDVLIPNILPESLSII